MSNKTTRRQTTKALDRALRDTLRIDGYRLNRDRIIVFSDVHKGDGRTPSDDFHHNTNLYCYALQHYFDHGYTLILNGDCEDCWETDPAVIVRMYRKSAFAAERKFNEQGRYFRVFGNHDDDWADPAKVEHFLVPVLGPVRVVPSVLLGGRIFIVHGHQGDRNDDLGARRSRWMVRHIWTPLQQWGMTENLQPLLRLFGFTDIGSAAQNNFVRRQRDQLMYEWAKANRLLLIAGHTHRGMFRSFSKIDQIRAVRDKLQNKLKKTVYKKKRLLLSMSIDHIHRMIKESGEELKKDKTRNRLDDNPVPCYFNDGCCVHTNGLTGIEIDRGKIRLVKWELSDMYYDNDEDAARNLNLFALVQRRIYQSGDLEEILSQILQS
jgi:UDP-2,3-diacylglucosamine pyrophosphatase LpxH